MLKLERILFPYVYAMRISDVWTPRSNKSQCAAKSATDLVIAWRLGRQFDVFSIIIRLKTFARVLCGDSRSAYAAARYNCTRCAGAANYNQTSNRSKLFSSCRSLTGASTAPADTGLHVQSLHTHYTSPSNRVTTAVCRKETYRPTVR